MRKVLLLALLWPCLTISATTYYVATNGNNSNPGTITQPWATWDYGFNHIKAGDILYIRGGTYTGVAGGSTNKFGVKASGLSGTSASHYTISAYPGEVPVLDCSSLNTTNGQNVAIGLYNSSYVDISGLTVINCTQHAVNTFAAPGFYESNVSYITHTQCTIHHCGDGFTVRDSYNYIYYTNCDVYEIADSYNDPSGALPGSLANGFYCAPAPGTHIYYTGCRAWNCSDDGWDEYGGAGYIELTNCWAFNNGWCDAGGPIANTVGDGSGFKLGPTTSAIESGFQRLLKNCLAIGNRGPGFDQNASGNTTNVRHAMYNCVSANNKTAGFQYYYDHLSTFQNNLSYNNGAANEFGTGSTINHNSWQNSLVVNSSDFASIDATQLAGPRKADGSLPDISFMNLVTGSDLIDAGVNVGLAFTGSNPDIGAFEIKSGTTITIPVLSSASVENATSSLLDLTYSLALANILPAASSFVVQLNSATRSVTSVVISGSKVQLTLSTPVLSGDVVTVAYTKPSANPIQTTTGGQAASISAQTVTNKVAAVAVINPVYVSTSVENSTPSVLEMTYNLSLASVIPSASSFSVLVNNVTRSVTLVAISGSKVKLTLASRILPGDKVTVTYTKPSGNYLQTLSAGIAESISNQPVVNNCINVAPTALLTSPLTNSSFTSPASISLTATAADTDGSVSLVEFYNGSVKIGSSSKAPYSFTWSNVATGTYSLTAVATDNLNAKTTTSSVSVVVQDVKKASNKRPVINIFNPKKGSSIGNLASLSIEAIASDPDGTVSKVEFYNGDDLLVEMTDAPYSFTWKNVMPGTYTITAVATDNMNDTTLSVPVEFVVGQSARFDANSDIVKLFPNPSNGHFSAEFVSPLKGEKNEIVITDLNGKQVYKTPVSSEELTMQFDLTGSRTGIYVMMVKNQDILVTKKFIIN